MICETFRARVCAEPAQQDETILAHANACAPCHAFHTRLLKTEVLIGNALSIGVPPAGAGNALLRRVGRLRLWRTGMALGMAASVIAAVALWFVTGPADDVSAAELAQAVVAHWDHEPQSLVRTRAAVPEAQLTAVLNGMAELDPGAGALVSYAKICRIAGQRVPHIVVQGEQGPYMVVLLPGRVLESPVRLQHEAGGLIGHILPAGAGSIAVLGSRADDLLAVESVMQSAISWKI